MPKANLRVVFALFENRTLTLGRRTSCRRLALALELEIDVVGVAVLADLVAAIDIEDDARGEATRGEKDDGGAGLGGRADSLERQRVGGGFEHTVLARGWQVVVALGIKKARRKAVDAQQRPKLQRQGLRQGLDAAIPCHQRLRNGAG